MNIKEIILARCYAKAFLNISGDAITETDFSAMCKGYDFFFQRKRLSFLMQLSALPKKIKNDGIEILRKELGLSPVFNQLLFLIIEKKHSFLFAELFRQLCFEYRRRNTITLFYVYSSIELLQEQKKVIKKFLHSLSGKRVICFYKIDTSLIAGIRLQSDDLLWENSIRQRLLHARRALL